MSASARVVLLDKELNPCSASRCPLFFQATKMDLNPKMITTKDIFGNDGNLLRRLESIPETALRDVALSLTRAFLAETESFTCEFALRDEIRTVAMAGHVPSDANRYVDAIDKYLMSDAEESACTEEAKFLKRRLDFMQRPSSGQLLKMLRDAYSAIDRMAWSEVVPEIAKPTVANKEEYSEWVRQADNHPRTIRFLEKVSLFVEEFTAL